MHLPKHSINTLFEPTATPFVPHAVQAEAQRIPFAPARPLATRPRNTSAMLPFQTSARFASRLGSSPKLSTKISSPDQPFLNHLQPQHKASPQPTSTCTSASIHFAAPNDPGIQSDFSVMETPTTAAIIMAAIHPFCFFTARLPFQSSRKFPKSCQITSKHIPSPAHAPFHRAQHTRPTIQSGPPITPTSPQGPQYPPLEPRLAGFISPLHASFRWSRIPSPTTTRLEITPPTTRTATTLDLIDPYLPLWLIPVAPFYS